MIVPKFDSTGSLNVGPDAYEWIVERPILYVSKIASDVLGVETVIEIPAGFKTDLASIPRVFLAVVTPNGRERLAAIVHDYLYEKQPKWCTRKMADQIFLEAMTALGERWSRRSLMYMAVRIGGLLYWRKCVECKKQKRLRK